MIVTPPRASPLAVATGLGIVYVVWGSTYLAIAIAVQTLPPLLAAGARFGLAGVLLLGYVAVRRRPMAWPTLAQWRTATLAGGLLLLGGNGLVMLSERTLPSGIAAIMIATTPIWMALIDALLHRRAPSALTIGGLLVGLAGAAVLLVPLDGVGQLDAFWLLVLMTAPVWWATGSLVARDGPRPPDALLATGMQMFAGGAVLLVAGSALGELAGIDPSRFSDASLLALLYLLVFGSLVAFTAYIWLLDHVPITVVSTYAYVNPVVAVALGAVFLHEPITARTLIAAALILGAVVAIVSGRRRDALGPTAEEVAAAEAEAEAH
ncbi:MAG TPA: EamA family transporter [Candidatus Limnocylindria bacterium]|nr:EamA family transporter [Candidatus Limnocylindria bacterium]